MIRAPPISEVVMLSPIDALPLAVERAGEPPWRQAVTRSVRERCDLSEFDKCEIGREAYQPYNYRGTVIRLDDSEKELLMRWKVAVGAVYATLAIALVAVIVMQAYL